MSPTNNASTWIVSCSPERTLVARPDPDGHGTQMIKLFERGSLSSAQRELAFAQLCAGQGFARYRQACKDPGSGKPSLVMDYYPGGDLLDWVTEHGPMGSIDAATITAQLADRLVTLASLRGSIAPFGIVHRDIKPSNIILHGDSKSVQHCEVIVLDLEHAIATRPDEGNDTDSQFSGGSHGYAPPEAYRGATPKPSFDVFGLGCTLQFLVTGNPAYRADSAEQLIHAVQNGERNALALIGIPDHLRKLIDACLAKDPGDRPRAQDISTGLAEFIAGQSDDDLNLDRILVAIQSGDLTRAKDGLTAVSIASRCSRWSELSGLCQAAQRMLADHLSQPSTLDTEGDESAELLVAKAPKLVSFLTQFPGHRSAIRSRRMLLRNAGAFLLKVPQLVAAHKQAGEFSAAQDLVAGALAAIDAVDQLGRMPVSGVEGEQPPPPLRDPRRFLAATKRDLDLSSAQHQELLSALVDAETQLDMNAAEEALANLTRIYGGASPVVSDLKERVHRLDFYLARIAKLAPTLEPLREQLQLGEIEIDLGEVDSFLAECSAHMPDAGGWQPTAEGESLLKLRRHMVELIAEYPHLHLAVEPAQTSLNTALATITTKAWDLLDSAKKKLATPPIPIRPLQNILNQLDHFRIGDMLVDQPKRRRAALLDQLEDLRMELDHSRNARDRITRGVQASMEEGHLTTALYELSRAVDRFDDEDIVSAPEGSPLAHQFAEAKRRKEEIEEAQRKNHQLASQFVQQARDGTAGEDALLTLLQDRERILQFLCASLGEQRREMYMEDLRVVQLELMRRHASKGASLVATVKHPRQRLVIAEQTLNALSRLAPPPGKQLEHHAEASALLHTWEKIHLSASGELSDEAAERRREDLAKRARHSRWVRRSAASVGLVVISMTLLLIAFLQGDSGAGTRTSLDALQQTLTQLQAVPAMPVEIAAQAETLLSLLRESRGDQLRTIDSWTRDFSAAMTTYDHRLASVPESQRDGWLALGRDFQLAGQAIK